MGEKFWKAVTGMVVYSRAPAIPRTKVGRLFEPRSLGPTWQYNKTITPFKRQRDQEYSSVVKLLLDTCLAFQSPGFNPQHHKSEIKKWRIEIRKRKEGNKKGGGKDEQTDEL